MELMNAKGTQDINPEEKILKNEIIAKLNVLFELYGYSPLETPILERLDVLTAKFAAGDESDAAKEIFKLKDQGDRELGLRFDLTVPLARFVAMNPMLKMPFKRYQIGQTFRDGPIKLGRWREFWQCDVDVVGCKAMTADAEVILLALDFFERMDFDAYIEVNNRKLLTGILEDCGIDEADAESVIISIDKLNKLGQEGVSKELFDKKIDKDVQKKLFTFFEGEKKDTKALISDLRKKLKSPVGIQGLDEIEELFGYIEKSRLKDIELNISFARGLSYYTGTVFEGFLRESKVTSSICGGGRYDRMIGMYTGGKRDYPAVGISFGLVPITEALKADKKSSSSKSVTKLFIIPIKTVKECFEIAKIMRANGIKTEVDLVGRGISKNLSYANTLEIPYVLFVGQDELKEGKLKLRDMKKGEEFMISMEEVCSKLREE